MRTPIQPLTWLVVVIAGWVQRDQQAAIVYLLEKNRVLRDDQERPGLDRRAHDQAFQLPLAKQA